MKIVKALFGGMLLDTITVGGCTVTAGALPSVNVLNTLAFSAMILFLFRKRYGNT